MQEFHSMQINTLEKYFKKKKKKTLLFLCVCHVKVSRIEVRRGAEMNLTISITHWICPLNNADSSGLECIMENGSA